MPDAPNPSTRQMTIRLPRTIYVKIEKKARSLSLTVSELMRIIIEKETRGIELTSEDYLRIAKEIAIAEQKRK